MSRIHSALRVAVAGVLLLLTACTHGMDALESPDAVAYTTAGPWASMVYLARVDDGVIVIGLGWDPDPGLLDGHLAELDAERRDVRAVFLTHSHRDHIAAWPALRHATFVLAEAEVPLLVGGERHGGVVPKLVDRIAPPELPEPGELDLVAFAGDTAFAFGRDTVRAFLIGGHTSGSAVYLFRSVLFVGDAANYNALKGWGPAVSIYSDESDDARVGLRRLIRRLRDAEPTVETVCTAHAKCAPVERVLAGLED